MKKIILIAISFALLISVLSSCAFNSHKNDDSGETAAYKNDDSGETAAYLPDTSSNAQETSGNEEFSYLSMYADWPWYSSPVELIEKADFVFTGKISDISFAVLDSRDGSPVTNSTPKHNRNLYTLYHVDVIDNYKGVSTKALTFKVMGGLLNYNESAQMKLMKDNDARFADEGIPIWEGYTGYDIGVSYLFVLCASASNYPNLLNIEQSVYPLSGLSAEDITEMSKSSDISPITIVKLFGDDKMSSFIDKIDKNIYE